MPECSTPFSYYFMIACCLFVLIYFLNKNDIPHETCLKMIYSKPLPNTISINENRIEGNTAVGGTSAHSATINAKPLERRTTRSLLREPYMGTL